MLLLDELRFNSTPLEALIQNKLLASVAHHLHDTLRERTILGTQNLCLVGNCLFLFLNLIFLAKTLGNINKLRENETTI